MSQARPLQGFNGLRALACLSVVLYHTNQHRFIENLSQWNWDLYLFVGMWPVAVSLFFILSAITNSLPFWRAILRDMPVPKTRELFVSRFFRIAPAYYLALIVTFFLSLTLNGYTDGAFIRFLAGATFLTWTHPFTFFPVDINGPLWYISYDMMGAILVMGTMSLLVRIRKIYIPLTIGLIIGILIALHFAFMSIPFPYVDGIVSIWFPAYNPFIFGVHFMMGVIVAGILTWREKNHSSHSLWYDLLFLITSTILIAFLWNIREAGDFDYTYLHSAYRFPLATIIIALIILFIPSTKYIGKYLDNRVFRTIARLSYATYLWHTVVMIFMFQWIFGGEYNLLMPEWFFLTGGTFIGAFGLAWLSYTYIEIPVSNWWRTQCEKKKEEK